LWAAPEKVFQSLFFLVYGDLELFGGAEVALKERTQELRLLWEQTAEERERERAYQLALELHYRPRESSSERRTLLPGEAFLQRS
jgi:hypothetical protein